MRNVKFFVSLLTFALIILIISSFILSASAAMPRVVDGDDLLTDEEESVLLRKLDYLSEEYRQDIVIVTVKSLGGKSSKLYADDFFDDNGYGYGESRSGILLLVCLSTRDYAISTSGDAMDIFGESDLDGLEDAFVSYLSSGDYFEAFNAFADECEYIIKYDKRLSPGWILAALAFGLVTAVIVISSMCKKHKNVKSQRAANNYILRNSFNLKRSRDVFLYSTVTRRVKPQNDSSGSSGRSRSSSGRSHGGRSGKF